LAIVVIPARFFCRNPLFNPKEIPVFLPRKAGFNRNDKRIVII